MKLFRTILCFAMLLSLLAVSVSAVPEEYEYPDDWSRDALVFAVENDILKGDQNHDLRPRDNITRGEMAAVLVRLLGAKGQADLSGYQDVSPNAWYYEELSAAVAAGIFGGYTATSMGPQDPITREQAASVICRAFAIVHPEILGQFWDWEKVSYYAREDVSALKSLGFLMGYENGTFQPRRLITRAEVAQIIYGIFDVIADTPLEIPSEGNVLYRGTEPLPETLSLDGNLVVGMGLSQLPQAPKWTVSGSLAFRTSVLEEVDLTGTSAASLALYDSGLSTLGGTFPQAALLGDGTAFQADTEILLSRGGTHKASGTYGNVQVRKGTLILDGYADRLELVGQDASVSGPGHAEKIVAHVKNPKVEITYDAMENSYQTEHDRALEVVETMRVPCRVLNDTALYQNQNLTNKICNVPAGSTVYNEWHPNDTAFMASLPNGTKGWIPRWSCSINTEIKCTDGTKDYSAPIKEGFVDLNRYDSKTPYLVWVSKYTQKVIVFQGSQGHWNLMHTFPCATGANLTPTPAGVYEIYYHNPYWYSDEYFMYTASGFSGGHAFHSVLMRYDGSYYDGRVGIPLSHGCVRMLKEHAQFIYDLPMNTRVVVY